MKDRCEDGVGVARAPEVGGNWDVMDGVGERVDGVVGRDAVEPDGVGGGGSEEVEAVEDAAGTGSDDPRVGDTDQDEPE